MKPVFLDRDGVISVFTPDDYIKTWEEFQFLPGAIEGLKKLNDAEFSIIVISNQAGVGKGVMTQAALNQITDKMLSVLKENGISILKIYYCPHTSEDNCACRKPKTGLFEMANRDFGPIDFSKAFFVGDSSIDIEAGESIGARTILVLSGRTGVREEIDGWKIKPNFVAKDLSEAADIIISGVNS